ncbi:MAG: aldolase/citrate lyase family protein [Chloroflexota bacterium]
MRENRLRQLLNDGQPSIGTHVHSMWPSVVEAIGHTGMFDYVEFVAEYAPFDLFSLDNFCRAVELFDMSSMIKVDQEPRGFLAQRGIGAGFQSVLFADCRSADEVRECVRIARPDTPQDGGTYGANSRRFTYRSMAYGGTAEHVQAIRDVVVVAMIEKRSAVDELDEILSIEGLDMVQWGPSDYSMSIGRPGETGVPEVQEAERRVFESALKAGIQPRAEISSPDEAKRFLDMGVRHFCIGTDINILYNWLRSNGDALRKAVSYA